MSLIFSSFSVHRSRHHTLNVIWAVPLGSWEHLLHCLEYVTSKILSLLCFNHLSWSTFVIYNACMKIYPSTAFSSVLKIYIHRITTTIKIRTISYPKKLPCASTQCHAHFWSTVQTNTDLLSRIPRKWNQAVCTLLFCLA